jgi:quinoprotein glucose dehydrogenase
VKPVLPLSLAFVLLLAAQAAAQSGAPNGEWPAYGGDLGSTKYSALDQIDAGNVDRVGVAWQWSSPDNALAEQDERLSSGAFKGTPIMVDGVLYLRTSLSLVAAIDAASGEELWSFDPLSHEAGRPTNLGFNTRGVAHWADGQEAKIFVATGDSHLWALDAATGEPDPAFGGGGRIDLLEGLRRSFDRGNYQVMSPPLVIDDVVIVGSSIFDGPQNMTSPPGDVRAFDVRTGRQRWIFHTVPQQGEFGNETWDDGSAEYTGATNVWTVMSADPELGYVYLPIGTPTNDWYGGHRPGDNLFGESLVAIDASTGERVWHFQMVHHGLWDYDLPAAPTLMNTVIDGVERRLVIQVTKQGFAFVFDRVTGEPIWPIVELPVPQSTVAGEVTSPTQPFPTRPAPYERQGITMDDLIDFTPELRAEAAQTLAGVDYSGLYAPPTLRGVFALPGWFGGANWHGASADPETGLLYVPSHSSPIMIQLVEPNPERSDFRYVRGGGRQATGPQRLPLIKPPYARLTAIDLKTGEHAWQIPLGDGPRQRLIDMGVPDPGPLGGQPYTGPLLTETLLFIGHGGPRNGNEASPALLVLDKATGRTIEEIELPAEPTGTPMTYMVGDRQFIAVAVNGEDGAGLVGLALDQ